MDVEPLRTLSPDLLHKFPKTQAAVRIEKRTAAQPGPGGPQPQLPLAKLPGAYDAMSGPLRRHDLVQICRHQPRQRMTNKAEFEISRIVENRADLSRWQ